MKKLGLLTVSMLCCLFLYPGSSMGSFLNAPHNEANGVSCVNCHQYPFTDVTGWGFTAVDGDDTIRNFVCLNCHGSSGLAPLADVHSSLNITGLAGWTTQCVDCHDPHFQAQLSRSATEAASLFLVRAAIDNVTDNLDGTSTVSYTSSLATIDPAWADPATWSAKTSAGRGLILVTDVNNPYETYEVVSATATGITVNGVVNPVVVGNTFGLIYGQLIKDTVAGKAVRFTGPSSFAGNDGLAAGGNDSTPDGICQVCHTGTKYWRNDGSLGTHNDGKNCAACHDHAQGFKPVAKDHTATVTFSAGCSDCHTGTDVVADVHLVNPANSCDTCHASPRPEVQAAIAAHSAECVTCHTTGFISIHSMLVDLDTRHSGIVTVGASNCARCHSNPPPLVDPANVKNHNACVSCHGGVNGSLSSLAAGKYNATGDCTTCHGVNKFEQHTHTHNITATTGCVDCHSAADIVGVIHLSNPANSCETCHSSTDSKVSGAIAAGAAECVTCHTAGFTAIHTPIAPDHGSLVQVGTTICANCHSNPPPLVDPANVKNHNACVSCHGGANGSLSSLAVGKDFVTGGDCTTCHGANKFEQHTHTHNITATTGCVDCHSATDIVGVIHLSNPANTCETCHASTDPKVSGAIAAGAAECVTCHTAGFTAIHTPIAPDHTALVTTAGTSNCANCHSTPPPLVDPNTGTIHNACVSCHGGVNGSLSSLAAGKTFAAGGNCSTCHGDPYHQMVEPYKNSCSTCHAIKGPGQSKHDYHVNNEGLACNFCHQAQPNCTPCHNFESGPGAATHDKHAVNKGISCDTCHITVQPWGGPISEPYGNCAYCHLGKHNSVQYGGSTHDKHINEFNGNCQACHGQPTPPCFNCHFGDQKSIHNKHDKGGISCTDCHVSGAPSGTWP